MAHYLISKYQSIQAYSVIYSIIERKPLNAEAGDWGNDERQGGCVFLPVTLTSISTCILLLFKCSIGAYNISVTWKQRIRDIRHLLIMHIIKLRSSNLKKTEVRNVWPHDNRNSSI
jgi:hypothetical protein